MTNDNHFHSVLNGSVAGIKMIIRMDREGFLLWTTRKKRWRHLISTMYEIKTSEPPLKQIIGWLLAGLAIFAFVGFFGVFFSNAELNQKIGLVSSVSLSIGVFIGWLTYISNLEINRNKYELDISFSYLNECIHWFNKSLEILNESSQIHGEFVFQHEVPANDKLERVAQLLRNITVLRKEIKIDSHKTIYEMHKDNIKNEIYDLFSSIDEESLASFHWGENKPLDERINDFNLQVKKNKEEGGKHNLEWIKQQRQTHDCTPFPRGIPTPVLYEILDFFGDHEEILDERLDSVRKYLELCAQYENVDGELIKQE